MLACRHSTCLTRKALSRDTATKSLGGGGAAEPAGGAAGLLSHQMSSRGAEGVAAAPAGVARQKHRGGEDDLVERTIFVRISRASALRADHWLFLPVGTCDAELLDCNSRGGRSLAAYTTPMKCAGGDGE